MSISIAIISKQFVTNGHNKLYLWSKYQIAATCRETVTKNIYQNYIFKHELRCQTRNQIPWYTYIKFHREEQGIHPLLDWGK